MRRKKLQRARPRQVRIMRVTRPPPPPRANARPPRPPACQRRRLQGCMYFPVLSKITGVKSDAHIVRCPPVKAAIEHQFRLSRRLAEARRLKDGVSSVPRGYHQHPEEAPSVVVKTSCVGTFCRVHNLLNDNRGDQRVGNCQTSHGALSVFT